jgi:hypothetical protein
MNIAYEISEGDFANAQRLAVKNSPMRIVRWSRIVRPLLGVAGLAFLFSVVAQPGFSWRVIPAGGSCVLFVSLTTPEWLGTKKGLCEDDGPARQTFPGGR